MDIAARVRPKGQVTIPREIREALAIEVGDEVVFRVERDHSAPARVVLQAVEDDSFWNPPSPDELIRASGVGPYVFKRRADEDDHWDVEEFLDSIFGDRRAP